MRILTLENSTFNLTNLPDEIDDDIRFAVLDNSDSKNPDFFFVPLILLESFSSPAVVIEVGNKEIMVPLDWHIALGDRETGNDIEILPITSLNLRGFEAFLFNPLTSGMTRFEHVKVVNFYNDVTWYFPKMRNGQLLALPLEEGNNPQCIYIVKEISRQSELIDYAKLL